MLKLPARRETTKLSSPCSSLLTAEEMLSTSTAKKIGVENLSEPIEKIKVTHNDTIEVFEGDNVIIANGRKCVYEQQQQQQQQQQQKQNMGLTRNRTSQSSFYSSTSLSSSFIEQEIIIHEPTPQCELETNEAVHAPQSNCFLTVNVNNFCNGSNATKYNNANNYLDNNNTNYNYADNVTRAEKTYNTLSECTCSDQLQVDLPHHYNNLIANNTKEEKETMTCIKESLKPVLTLPYTFNKCDDATSNNTTCIYSEETKEQQGETENEEKQCEPKLEVALLRFHENSSTKYVENDKTLHSVTGCESVKFDFSENINNTNTCVVNNKASLEQEKHDDDNDDDFVLQATSEMKAAIKSLKEPRKPGHSIGNWARMEHSQRSFSKLSNGTTVPHHLMQTITEAEAKKHNTREDMWIVIDDVVYDITKFANYHPGGGRMLEQCAGKDATALYNSFHPWVSCEAILGKFVVGKLQR